MRSFHDLFYKQSLRRGVSQMASYIEIVISFVIIIGLIPLVIRVGLEVKNIVLSIFGTTDIESLSMMAFLAMTVELVIGIEFVKMLVKHTPGSAIEVLLYTIARKLIAEHGSIFEILIGVVAIAILFAIRRYLNDPDVASYDFEGEFIVRAGVSVREVNKKISSNFNESDTTTILHFFLDHLGMQEADVRTGTETQIGDYRFQVHERDEGHVETLKITHVQY